MNYYVNHQKSYSRGELLLRTLFGPIYIGIPHGILIMILAIGFMFVRIFTFWICLITGKYPRGLFDYQVKFMRYQLRVNARLSNLADGYPAFGLDGTDDHSDFDVPYREEVSRSAVLIRALFGGIYVMIPHVFVLVFRAIATLFLNFIAFWAILFTGKYPIEMFDFVVGTGRWGYRIQTYLNFYTDEYPAFTGKVLPGENENISSTMRNDNEEILD
jgi:hypothetical protein